MTWFRWKGRAGKDGDLDEAPSRAGFSPKVKRQLWILCELLLEICIKSLTDSSLPDSSLSICRASSSHFGFPLPGMY